MHCYRGRTQEDDPMTHMKTLAQRCAKALFILTLTTTFGLVIDVLGSGASVPTTTTVITGGIRG
jgi:hypothetical protein